MHMKTIVSAGALAIALGFAGTAFAQDAAPMAMPTEIGGQTLSEADAERVSVFCADLETESNQAEGATNDDTDAAESEEAGGSADTAAVGSVDMSLITIETCAEAGFIEGPVSPTP